MNDCVLSYHVNPQTCGVAKANHRLARELGVPVKPLTEPATYPLVSIKPSELPSEPYIRAPRFDLWLHGPVPRPWRLKERATRIFHAHETGCPSTVEGNPTRGAYRVLTFGMAHKLVLPHFQALKARLDWEQPDYTLHLSTAVHEGSPWDAALTDSVCAMRAIFGDRLRILGFLGDDALARELQDCDAVAMFFTPALRANNTSYWAAKAAAKVIYTNRDAQSPQEDDPVPTWDQLAEVFRAS